ncbi:hypothetical protein GJ698_00905 [Pseudoduganella sp. FT26W]|uniref:Uncharacterized protein n=1 Tax=Duganella aquatilis TaxID=2666082 RepID=A0A844CRU2_9BURK|nr:hypothetical protein [Duganella aquatilis]MRW82648.1 hypothetical protein [Duganella aquatilis]
MTPPSSEQACSAVNLRHMLAKQFPDQFMALTDLFAVGCLMHYQGERCASHRLMAQVSDTLCHPAEKNYFALLLNRLSGNELRFAREIKSSLEVIALFERMPQPPAREAACIR